MRSFANLSFSGGRVVYSREYARVGVAGCVRTSRMCPKTAVVQLDPMIVPTTAAGFHWRWWAHGRSSVFFQAARVWPKKMFCACIYCAEPRSPDSLCFPLPLRVSYKQDTHIVLLLSPYNDHCALAVTGHQFPTLQELSNELFGATPADSLLLSVHLHDDLGNSSHLPLSSLVIRNVNSINVRRYRGGSGGKPYVCTAGPVVVRKPSNKRKRAALYYAHLRPDSMSDIVRKVPVKAAPQSEMEDDTDEEDKDVVESGWTPNEPDWTVGALDEYLKQQVDRGRAGVPRLLEVVRIYRNNPIGNPRMVVAFQHPENNSTINMDMNSTLLMLFPAYQPIVGKALDDYRAEHTRTRKVR